jgi:hypothetical protein
VFAIRAVFALTPAAFSIAAFFIAWRFPIDERVHRAILEAISAHGRGESAVDPLTQQLLPPPAGREVDERTSWFLDYFSVGELGRVLARGPEAALSDVLRVAALSLAIAIGLGLWVAQQLADTGGNPGPFAVIGIVVAGFAITVFVFHLSRIAPALELRRSALPPQTIRAHLAHVNGENAAVVEPTRAAAANRA